MIRPVACTKAERFRRGSLEGKQGLAREEATPVARSPPPPSGSDEAAVHASLRALRNNEKPIDGCDESALRVATEDRGPPDRGSDGLDTLANFSVRAARRVAAAGSEESRNVARSCLRAVVLRRRRDDSRPKKIPWRKSGNHIEG